MAAVQPYQRVLLENRDILLNDLNTDDVIPLLFLAKVLSNKEIDDIEIGRTRREKTESLLDVLHYKGDRGFDEFCKALEETFPHLASRMSRRDSHTERTEKYHNEVNLSTRYSSSYTEHERSHRETNGDDFHRYSERSSERVIGGSERPSEMRGEPEPQYAQVIKRPKDSSQMDGSRRGEDNRSVSSYHSQRHDRDRDTRSLDGDRRRTPRRAMDEVNPSESYIYEKNTVVVEKANTNQGFGIAVSGGRDNPHNKTGDTSIVVSDIVKGSPADGLLRVNDIIVQVNDVNVEHVYHRDAVQALKDSGVSARLIIKRRKAMPALPKKNGSLPTTVHLSREAGRGFGFSLAMRLYIKDIDPKGLAFHEGELDPGDVILKINDRKAEELKLREAIELVRKSDNLELVIAKHKMDNLNLSTRSLPLALHKRGFSSKPVENGVDDVRNDNDDVGRGRSRSMDRTGHEVQSFEIHEEKVHIPDETTLTNAEPEGTQSEKPVVEQAVVKQEVQKEESVPDLPPRRYSDAEAPKRPQPPDEEDRGGAPFSSSSWKRLDNERPREEEHRLREPERRDYVPQPADVTRTEATMDLSMKTWDSLSPGRTPARESPGSTPRSQRREEKPRDYMAEKDTKVISFRKEGSLGIQIQGGNKTGIFVAAVRESNPAHRQGLRRGDQVLMANDIDFKDITREEAVLLLLSLGDDVRLLAQPKSSTFERIKNSPGDSFYIKAHFDYGKMKDDELDINREDVFHVWDTMYGGMIGSWHAQRVIMNNEETETGVIPNKCRAEQLGQVRQVEEDKTPSKKASRTNSLKRKDSRGGTLKKNYMFVSTDKLDKESFINTTREFKLPAYERVSLRHPGFVRPVVLLGPIADITRDKLLQDLPQYFAIPTAYGGITPAGHESPTKSSRRTLSYSTIKAVIDNSKHCLLDIAPDEVERLNYSQLYPIVLFLKPPNKNVVKEMRAQHGTGKESAKHIKKLYDNSVKLEQFYFNMFSATIRAGPSDDWYGRVKDEIKKQQDRRVWMSEDKFEHDEHDVEFRVHNRYSVGYDNDSHADSPTARSSVSHPPDEEIRPSVEQGVESAPRYYNGPEVEYRDDGGRYDDDRDRDRDRDRSRYDYDRDRDRSRYDDDRDRSRYDDDRDRDRSRYDDDRDRDRSRYDDDRDRRPYDDEQHYDNDIDRASKPGYKPHGNIVKVLPSSQEPVELRASLRKTRPLSDDFSDKPPDTKDGDDLRPRDSLRRTEPETRPQEGVNPTELELKYKAESLRKVEPESDLLKKYDERVGVKVSDLWAIDNEVKRERIQPQEVVKVESKPDDLERKLEELERAIPPSQPKEEPKKVLPAPYRFEPRSRNVVVDYRSQDRPESVVRTSYYPARSYATVTHVQSKSEPEVRATVMDRVESAPVMENGYRSLPRDYGRGGAEPERKEIYRAEVTIPRKETKPERPKSAYGYSTQAYAPRPYSSDRSSEPPPRPAQPTNYDFKLSSRPQSEIRREPEPRPGTYRSEYRPKVADFEAPRDESQVITSDFESLDDDTQVVATARGTFTSKGGVLSSPESGVSIHIPEGAIPCGIEQEIYFKVCKDNNIMPPLDTDKGETLLSPLVMCGPHGTQFRKPVELRLPHCASMTPDGWSFALKSSETPTGMPTQWQNVSIPGQEKKGDPNSVSVLVDHF